MVVRLRRAGRQRRRALQPLQPERGGRRGHAGAARDPAARPGWSRPSRSSCPPARSSSSAWPTSAPCPTAAQRRVRHRAGDAGRRRARAHPHDRRRGRRRRSPSVRPPGPTATSPTRGTSDSARRRRRRGALALYNNTTATRRVTLQAVTPDGIQNVPGLADIAVAAGGDPLHRPHRRGVARQPADRALDDTDVRRAGRCPASPTPRAASPSWAVPANARRRAAAVVSLIAARDRSAIAVVQVASPLGRRRRRRPRRRRLGRVGGARPSSTALDFAGPDGAVAGRRVHVGDVRPCADVTGRGRRSPATTSPSTTSSTDAARRAPALPHRRRADARRSPTRPALSVRQFLGPVTATDRRRRPGRAPSRSSSGNSGGGDGDRQRTISQAVQLRAVGGWGSVDGAIGATGVAGAPSSSGMGDVQLERRAVTVAGLGEALLDQAGRPRGRRSSPSRAAPRRSARGRGGAW